VIDKLKSAGAALFGLLILVAMLALIGLLIGGASWLSDHLLPLFATSSVIAFGLLVTVFLPLSAFRKTRSFGLAAIFCASILFGATAWMEGLVTTELFWGTWGVIIGLCFAGVGVVPMGMLAAFFHGEWSELLELLALIALTFGCRFYAIWMDGKAQTAIEPDYIEGLQQIDDQDDDSPET
jgi:uncharacterized membrane protein (GlpM family)